MSYTIVNVIKDALTGKIKFAPRAETHARKNICEPCEIRNVKTNVCTACGCYLPLKIRLKKSTCPMELW